MKIKENCLFYNDISIKKIIEKHSTPVIIYDYLEIEKNLESILFNLDDKEYKLNICYASKAFLCKALIRYLKNKNLYIDAVSLGDLILLKKSNFNMKRVIFHGNNKSSKEIIFAIKNEVIIVVDHISELLKICNYETNKKIKIFLRINTHINCNTHDYIKTALGDSKFGISIFSKKELNTIFNILKKTKNIDFLGFHSHIGSQIFDILPFQKLFNALLQLTQEANEEFGFKITKINFGGGFGVPYLNGADNFNFSELSLVLKEEVKNYNAKSKIKLEEVYFEPGRSIISSAGTTYYSVGHIKKTYTNKKYIFIDGGMNDNIRPALYQAEYQVEIVNKINDEKKLKYDIAGKCCEQGDIIKKNAILPEVCENDILAVFCTGAYCYSMSSNYNNNLKPKVLYYSNNKIKKMLRTQRYNEFLS